MPTVPADTRNRVSLQPVDATPIRAVDAAAPAREIAQGVAGLGQSLGGVAQDLQKIEDIYDEAAVSRADTLAIQQLSEARRQAISAQGFDAQTAHAQFTERTREIAREIETSLSNDVQRRMFRDVYTRRSVSDLNAVGEHATREVLTARRAAGVARVEAAMAHAVDNYADPDAVSNAFATVDSEIAVIHAGMGPEVQGQKRAEARSVFRAQVVQNLATTDPIAAQQYLDEHAGDILPEAEIDLRNRLRPRFDEAIVEGAFAEVIGTTTVPDVNNAPPDQPEEGVYDAGNAPPAETDTTVQPEPAPATQPVARDPLRGRGGQFTGRFNEDRGTHRHTGVDIPAPEGTPIYPPMEGRVVASWFDDVHGGGNSVVVEHPDGRRTGYAHLRNRAVNVGDEVNINTVLGGVGNTGRSTGPHLHYTVRDAEGNRVDPTGQTWGGSGTLQGRTPSRGDAQARQTLGAYYERARQVAEARGLSQSQLEDLYTRIDRHYSRQEGQIRSAREIASDQAYEYVANAETEGRPVNLSEVPGYGDMDPQQRISLRNYVNDGNGRDNTETYFNLLEMSANPARQDEFASLDLNQYRSRISSGEFSSLVREQQAIRYPGSDHRGRGGNRAARPARRAALSRIRSAITALGDEIGLNEGGTGRAAQTRRTGNRARLERYVRESTAAWQEQNPGQEVPDDVIDHFVRTGSRIVRVNVGTAEDPDIRRVRRYGVTNPRGFTLGEDIEQVPATDRAQIRDAFRRTHGRLPTNAELVAAYIGRLSEQ